MSDVATMHLTAAVRRDYDLLRRLVTLSGLDWIVVRTNPNCEDRARKSLSAAGLVAYLPLQSKVGHRKRGVKKQFDVSHPLIPRYVFVGLDRGLGHHAEMVRTCDGVENILTFAQDRMPHIVPATQMRALVETAFQAQTDQKYVVPQCFDIGGPIKLMNETLQLIKGEVTAYDQAKGQVSAEVRLFGRPVKAKVSVDKLRA